MDEARSVLNRLDRIERLEQQGASAAALVAELRSLVSEAEAWVRIERAPTRRAEGAIERLREALDETLDGAPEAAWGAGRTLLA
jgi:hypothetical protein